MKKNLGKFILLLFTLPLCLHATSLASYKLSANKTIAYVKEPIIITFTAKQIDNSDNMFFLLQAKKSPDYELHLLTKRSKEVKKHDAMVTFTYILFPLKAKKINVNFDFIIQTASNQALAQSYVDDHDGGKAVQTNNKIIHLKPFVLSVKAIPNVDLIGDFTLKSKCNNTKITQYEDATLIYIIQGKGYKNNKKNILTKIQGVTQFLEVHSDYLRLSKEGYVSKKIYTYALSAKEKFNIPAIKIKAYSPTKHKVYLLTAPSYSIDVTKINPFSLTDKEEFPKVKEFFSLNEIKKYFIYIFLFLAGYITAKFSGFSFLKINKEYKFQDIKDTQTAKELIAVLMKNHYHKDIKKIIDELEELAYRKSEKNFNQIKKEVLFLLS